jgi:hypothetical protein
MMLRGLWKLTWIELTIFLREPHSCFDGSINLPRAVDMENTLTRFAALWRLLGSTLSPTPTSSPPYSRVLASRSLPRIKPRTLAPRFLHSGTTK